MGSGWVRLVRVCVAPIPPWRFPGCYCLLVHREKISRWGGPVDGVPPRGTAVNPVGAVAERPLKVAACCALRGRAWLPQRALPSLGEVP